MTAAVAFRITQRRQNVLSVVQYECAAKASVELAPSGATGAGGAGGGAAAVAKPAAALTLVEMAENVAGALETTAVCSAAAAEAGESVVAGKSVAGESRTVAATMTEPGVSEVMETAEGKVEAAAATALMKEALNPEGRAASDSEAKRVENEATNGVTLGGGGQVASWGGEPNGGDGDGGRGGSGLGGGGGRQVPVAVHGLGGGVGSEGGGGDCCGDGGEGRGNGGGGSSAGAGGGGGGLAAAGDIDTLVVSLYQRFCTATT